MRLQAWWHTCAARFHLQRTAQPCGSTAGLSGHASDTLIAILDGCCQKHATRVFRSGIMTTLAAFIVFQRNGIAQEMLSVVNAPGLHFSSVAQRHLDMGICRCSRPLTAFTSGFNYFKHELKSAKLTQRSHGKLFDNFLYIFSN
jgi:hypothetical protein